MTGTNGSGVASAGGERTGDRTEVLIVGAGPTGLAMAIELARRGVDHRLVERNDHTVRTSRALGISPRTLQAFEDMGLLDEILAEGFRLAGQTMLRGDDRLFRIRTDSVDTGARYPYLWVLPQDRTERILLDRLEALGGGVEFGRELVDLRQDGDGVTARVRPADGDGPEETVTAGWLVGCDGAHSQVRESLGLAFAGETRAETFLLADALVDADWPPREALTWFHEDGVIAAFPLPGEGEWRLFVEVSSLAADERPAPTAETFERLLAERAGDRTATVREVTWSSEFTVNQRMVRRYRDRRVFLAGDAAHVHSPFGGMGMNTGIQDAYNLAWKLALVVGGVPEALLDSYEAERQPVAERVLGTTGPTTGLVTSTSSVVGFLREHVLGPVVSLRPVQARLLGATTQLDVDYRASPLSRSGPGLLGRRGAPSLSAAARRAWRAWRAPAPGDRAPDGPVCRPDGTRTSLCRELHGETGFALLLFAGTHDRERLATLARTVAEQGGDLVRPYLVVRGQVGTDGPGVDVLLDPDGRLHGRYGGARSLYLLRPDGYVCLRIDPSHPGPVLDYFGELGVPGPDARGTGVTPGRATAFRPEAHSV